MARVCREAGARVATNFFLRDMNLDTPVTDARQIEVVANGLPMWNGAQVAVDTTMGSPVSADGSARPSAAGQPGVPCRSAIRDKRERKYRELLAAGRCRLMVFAVEVGGRLDTGALRFLRKLAHGKARADPEWLRASTAHAHLYRWSAMLCVAAQKAYAATLVRLPLEGEIVNGEVPAGSEVLADCRFAAPVDPSRMPLRG